MRHVSNVHCFEPEYSAALAPNLDLSDFYEHQQ